MPLELRGNEAGQLSPATVETLAWLVHGKRRPSGRSPWIRNLRNELGYGGPGGMMSVPTTSRGTGGPGALPPAEFPISQATGASGGTIYEVVENSSAADATPTQQNEILVGVILSGGGAGGAGCWQYLYDGVHNAEIPMPASGLDATGAIGPEDCHFYPFNYGPIGTKIPAGSQTYIGGLARVLFIFSNRPNPAGTGPDPISAFGPWRGTAVTGNESGTSGTAKTYSIPGPLAKPTGVSGLASIQSGTATGIPIGRILFPAIGNYAAYLIPAELSRGYGASARPKIYPVPDYDPASSFSLTHKAITLGGATTVQILGILWY